MSKEKFQFELESKKKSLPVDFLYEVSQLVTSGYKFITSGLVMRISGNGWNRCQGDEAW